tara:strand:- start:356 stop:754 length:399 start_codon:yes stop_codon:yes gene_type:complete
LRDVDASVPAIVPRANTNLPVLIAADVGGIHSLVGCFLKSDMKLLSYFKEKARRSTVLFEVMLVQPGATVETETSDISQLLAMTELFLTRRRRRGSGLWFPRLIDEEFFLFSRWSACLAGFSSPVVMQVPAN